MILLLYLKMFTKGTNNARIISNQYTVNQRTNLSTNKFKKIPTISEFTTIETHNPRIIRANAFNDDR